MVFKRRNERTVAQKLREVVWPSMGWRRSAIYLLHRLARLPGTPYSIAAGFACGGAISFTPFLGFHFLISMALAWTMRASMVAALIGTVVGNPWTFPFIWFATYQAGSWMLGIEPGAGPAAAEIAAHPFETLSPIFLPLLAGSLPVGVAAWFIQYWPLRALVAKYQKVRRHRLERRAKLRGTSDGSWNRSP